MIIDCAQENPTDNYFTLIQTVIPRPIAWVLSVNGNKTYNLAPFSFFNAICSDPLLIMLSIGWKDELIRKDTWVNISERQEFVIHIPSTVHLKDVVDTSMSLEHGVSEIEELNISLERIEGQRLPKVKGTKAALFCEKYSIQEIGKDKQGLILGKVNHIWLDDLIVNDQKGRLTIDPMKLDPLARLGGSSYSSLGDLSSLKRPE